MANTSKRGFASMDPNKQREIASKGGRAAHAKGTAHEFTSDEARVAGRKGGEAVSRDRAHMSAIGREGGHSRGARARAVAGGDGGANDMQGGGVDYTRGSDQSFERQTVSERGGFEAGANRGTGGSNNDRDRSRGERSGDSQSNRETPYSGRENI
jgi:general stress protein YciG